MKTREQIYGQEAASILRDITMYRMLTKEQLLRLYPGKQNKVQNLLSFLTKQGRIINDGEYYAASTEALEEVDRWLLAAVWVLLDFIDRVEYHSTGDFPAKVIFFSDGEVYEIIQVEAGKEILVSQVLAAYAENPSRYLIMVDNLEQIAELNIPNVCGFCTVMIAIIVIFMRPILYAMGTTDTIYPYAREYAMIYVISSIFNIFNVTMNNIASSEGVAKASMTSMLLGAGLNVIFDPIFIYGFHTGIAGAAIATALAQAITTVMYLYYILQKRSVFSFSPKEFRFDKIIYGEIFKVGIPTLAFQLATSIAIGFTNAAAKEYGDAAIAAMGIVTRIISMGIYAVSGFAKGFMPIAGYNYGAKQYHRVQEATKTGLIWTSIFCVLMTILMLIFATQVISLFTADDLEVIEIGTFALRANIVMFAGMGIEAIYSMLSLALGKAAGGWLLSIGRQGIFFIPVIVLLPHYIGLNGVILAQPIADVLTLIAIIILAMKINRQIKALASSQARTE